MAPMTWQGSEPEFPTHTTKVQYRETGQTLQNPLTARCCRSCITQHWSRRALSRPRMQRSIRTILDVDGHTSLPTAAAGRPGPMLRCSPSLRLSRLTPCGRCRRLVKLQSINNRPDRTEASCFSMSAHSAMAARVRGKQHGNHLALISRVASGTYFANRSCTGED